MASADDAKPGLTYADAGVDYDPLDAFKRACQREAAATVPLLGAHGLREVDGTRGESAYLVDAGDGTFLAHVEEGLGTKNLVADAVGDALLYEHVGIDVVATIVNDLITVGCLPAVVAMHAAVGEAAWFNNTARAEALAAGFAEGCRRAGAAWGGGETPALAGIVERDAIVLAGSAIGRMPAGQRIRGDVEPGDAIVFLASTGVHTNGLTLCRRIGETSGYDADVGDGTPFGRALLTPSAIYVGFVKNLHDAGVRPRYLNHVTGHGWRKLMRPAAAVRYVIDTPGTPPPVFRHIAKAGPVAEREMYATFNMGVGFAAYVAPGDADATVAAAEAAGHRAWVAGEVADGAKSVEVPSLGLTFAADELAVR
jgi:phosphoribosylformylglycinamidine cyclo-ligase